MKWAATVLAAAASVVFGIWAPLSYDMSKGNNNESNAMQTAMLESIATANSIAQQALFTASAQAKVIQDTQAQLVAMGKLQLADYCRSYTVCVRASFPYAVVYAAVQCLSCFFQLSSRLTPRNLAHDIELGTHPDIACMDLPDKVAQDQLKHVHSRPR